MCRYRWRAFCSRCGRLSSLGADFSGIIGATVAAFATSSPELSVSINSEELDNFRSRAMDCPKTIHTKTSKIVKNSDAVLESLRPAGDEDINEMKWKPISLGLFSSLQHRPRFREKDFFIYVQGIAVGHPGYEIRYLLRIRFRRAFRQPQIGIQQPGVIKKNLV
jgi:hypothetical protein